MCIILFKKPGLAIDYNLLAASFHANPDGAGLMFPAQRQSGKVRVVKGFMEFGKLASFLHDNDSWLTSQPVNFHFRWRTHGDTDPANCHPFPITRDHRRLTQLDVVVPYAVMHNGVIPLYLAPNDPFFSDTAMFVRDRVAKRRGKRKMVQELRRTPGFNKFSLMEGTGHTTLVGQFTSPTSANGHLVSNTSYVVKKQAVVKDATAGAKTYTTPHRALPAPASTPWTGAAHYGSAPYDSYEDYAGSADGWWGAQQVKEREFLQEAGWQEDLWEGEDGGLVVPEDKGECELCGEKATCWVYQVALCVECMVRMVQDVPQEDVEALGVVTCPENGVG